MRASLSGSSRDAAAFVFKATGFDFSLPFEPLTNHL
jgi:hypothetical protein